MTNPLLTRAVELVYMSRGVPEADLSGTMDDARYIVEDCDSVSMVLGKIDYVLMQYGVSDYQYEDAEFLFNLSRALP